MEHQLDQNVCRSALSGKENQSPMLKSPLKRRARARSLGEAQDDMAIELSRPLRTKASRARLAPGKSILKSTTAYQDDFQSNHTVIGVMAVALKEENDEETDEEMKLRREKRKSLNRRVSFASHATVRTIPREEIPSTPVQTTPKGNCIRKSPSTPRQQNSKGEDSPLGKKAQPLPVRQSPRRHSAVALKRTDSLSNEEGEMSMDLASDETCPNVAAIVTSDSSTYENRNNESSEMSMDITQTYSASQDSPIIDSCTRGTNLGVDLARGSSLGGVTMDFTKGFGKFLQESPARLFPHESPISHSVFQGQDRDETPVSSPFIPHVQKSHPNDTFTMDNKQPTNNHQDESEVNMEETQIFGGFHIGTSRPDYSVEEDYTLDMNMTRPFSQSKIDSLVRNDDTIEMDFTQVDSIGMNQTMDMDITRSISAPPQRSVKPGQAAVEALLRRPSSGVSHSKSESNSINIKLGSPKAVNLLSKRRSISSVESFTPSKLVLDNAWEKEEFGANITTPTSSSKNLREMIKAMTPQNIERTPLIEVNVLKRERERNDETSPVQKKQKHLSPQEPFPTNSDDKNTIPDSSIDVYDENMPPPISLEEFLRLTGISFLDGLTTTRRRETMVLPPSLLRSPLLSDYVLASLVTLPTLELYQHVWSRNAQLIHKSCRELNNYITEGTNMCVQIEKDIFEEQPEMFREYIRADLETRHIMDCQFRLIKNYTRAQTRAIWYVWREKLLEGLLVGLKQGLDSLMEDKVILKRARDKLGDVVQEVKERHTEIKARLTETKQRKAAFLETDKDKMNHIGERIKTAEAGLIACKQEATSVQEQVASMTKQVRAIETRIQQAENAVLSAEKVCEENRPVDFSEITSLRLRLEWFERCTGWKVLKASAHLLILKFMDEVKVEFTNDSTRIEWVGRKSLEQVATDYFVNLLQAKCLGTVPQDWGISHEIIRELYLLRIRHPVSYTILTNTSPPKLRATGRLYIPSSRAMVLVNFDISETLLSEYPRLDSVETRVERVYGDLNIQEAERNFRNRIGSGTWGSWQAACGVFEEIFG